MTDFRKVGTLLIDLTAEGRYGGYWCSGITKASVHQQSPWWRHQMENIRRNWPFVRGIHRSPVKSLQKSLWCGALMFSLICAWRNVWVNNREADDLSRHRVDYGVSVMEPVDYMGSGAIDTILRNRSAKIATTVTDWFALYRHFWGFLIQMSLD